MNTDINASGFAAKLATGRPILLDGGFATQCEAMGCNIDGELWSAKLLRDDPGAVVRAHRAWLDAGAKVLATASYQASRRGFTAAGMTVAEADQLLLDSVALAQRARDEFMNENPDAEVPLIAASLGPYGAVLHDGSEYTGNYDISTADLRAFHEERVTVLLQSDADLLAFETIPNFNEAVVLNDLLVASTIPCWVSFSCRDAAHLADGSALADVARQFVGHPTVLALGANCFDPQLAVPLIAELKAAVPNKPIAIYPNSGERYRAEDNAWLGTATPLQCEQSVDKWLDAGAQLVGGCCRISPDQIAAMAAAIVRRL